MNSLAAPFAAIGRGTLDMLSLIGSIAIYAGQAISHMLRPPFYPREFLHQLGLIGWLSLPVVGLTALFTGGALALQIYAGGARFNAETVVPSIVAIGIVRELGPVLGGLMVAGRVAASIAAEIGTMKVTEQIDALTTLSTHPMKYLTVPRVLAAVVTLPILVAIGDAIGIMGGYLVGTLRLDFNAAAYMTNTIHFLEAGDVDLRAREGLGFRLHRGHHGLLSRHERGQGRPRRGPRHHRGGGVRLDPDPCLQLHPDRGVFLRMIEMQAIHKSFGPKQVLRGVDLTVNSGESMVIIGGSGTGKSVTIKCILGLIRPDSGRILLDGKDVEEEDRDAFLARFGMLFQGGALFDSLPVWQNVAFRLLRGSLKRPKAEAREIAIEKLRRVGLTPDVADQFPAELSGGMQKRVGLARAIAAEPQVIFFDEPTTGLDPIMAGVINDLIREIVVEMGATAMTITHDMSSVRAIADKVAMLHNGKIRWTGPVADMDTCGDPYVDQFINGRAEGPIEAVR